MRGPFNGRVDEAGSRRGGGKDRGEFPWVGGAHETDAVGGGERLVVDALGDAEPAVVGLGGGGAAVFESGEDTAAGVVGEDDVEPGSRGRGEREGGCVVAQGQVAHDGGDAWGGALPLTIDCVDAAFIRRGRDHIRCFCIRDGRGGFRGLVAPCEAMGEGHADRGGDGPVDAGLASVGVHEAPGQGGDTQVEGAHGVGSAEHERAGRGRGDGTRQVDHRAPGLAGEDLVDARPGACGEGLHARGPVGEPSRHRALGGLKVGHDRGRVAGSVDPGGAGVHDDDTHVGACEKRVNGPRQGRAPREDDGVDLAREVGADDGLLEGGHAPEGPRSGGGLGQERETRGPRPVGGPLRRALTRDDETGGRRTDHVLPALGHRGGGEHPGRARDERGRGLVPGEAGIAGAVHRGGGGRGRRAGGR